MAELLTAAQMRAIEEEAIASGRVTGLELMERAGQGVVEAIFEEWPELAATSNKAVVLCGPGNNGGDGFVVARLLKEWGWAVEVFFYGDPDKLPPDARVNYERWAAMGEVLSASEVDDYSTDDADLFLDALFGTGLTRPMDRGTCGLLSLCADRPLGSKPMVRVSIDIQSGFDADSGRLLCLGDETSWYEGFYPELTVTFHCAKRGHFLGLVATVTQRLATKCIGLGSMMSGAPASKALIAYHEIPKNWELERFVTDLVDADLAESARYKHSDEHKYSYGHAVVLSGAMGRSGAARLAARAALRVGAGLVTVAAPGSAMMECATQLTAIMLRKCNDADGLAALLEDKRLNALCLGPGLGVGEGTRTLVAAALADQTRAVVLDADALTSFTERPEDLFALLHRNVVLTPHAGEFARLFPSIAEKLQGPATKGPAYSKVDATCAAATRAGCTVLFKGPDTVIADPSGRCAINAAVYNRAAPWLATAGSGDVLAGIITGLLARGLPPMQAAETAAWLHVEAARAFGPGLIAEDLPDMLPKVFRDMGL